MTSDNTFTWPLLDVIIISFIAPAAVIILIYSSWRLRQRLQRKQVRPFADKMDV